VQLGVVGFTEFNLSLERRLRHSRPNLHFLDHLVLLRLYFPHHCFEVLLLGADCPVLELVDVLVPQDVDGVLVLEEAEQTVALFAFGLVPVMVVLFGR
jgi:hypothetical protein